MASDRDERGRMTDDKANQMKPSEPFEFDHRGRHFRMERRGRDDWFLLEGNFLVDKIPANPGEQSTDELVALAKRAVNACLEGKTPRGL